MPRLEPAPKQAAASPRSRKGELTRSRLLEAAKAVFEETGFLEARISDIAVSAGLSHGSFYHYFESKEQIFREVADEQEALLTATSRNAEEPSDGADASEPLTEYDRIRNANLRYLQRYRDTGKIMGVIEEVSRYDSYVNDARMRRQKHFADRAEASIRRLQDQGAADPEVDAEIAAMALGSMIGRFAELWLVAQWADYEFDAAVDQISRLWANAIGLDVPSQKAPATKSAARKSAAAKKTSATKKTAGAR